MKSRRITIVFSVILSLLLILPAICSAEFHPSVEFVEWGWRGNNVYCIVENNSDRGYSIVKVFADVSLADGTVGAEVAFANVITPGQPRFGAGARIMLITPFPRIPNRELLTQMRVTSTEAW